MIRFSVRRAALCASWATWAVVAQLAAESPSSLQAAELKIRPASFVLRGRAASQQVIVSGQRDGREADLTGEVRYRSETPEVAHVDEQGLVTPVADGEGAILAATADGEARATVRVIDADRHLPVSFELDVLPVLTARGCSTGACHGKARGQNGFQLSLLDFDPDFDYESLTRNARGRRVFPAAAERSLLLVKPTTELPHGGGPRLERGEPDYETIRRWIAAGIPRRIGPEPRLEHVTVDPAHRFMRPKETQRLIVTAHYSDGTSRDVTGQTTFQSSESVVVDVDARGLVKAGPIPGEATIMSRYMGSIATTSVVIPLAGQVPASLYTALPRKNFIDELVWKKLQSLAITPAEAAVDAKFLRRVYVDIIGRLPTAERARAFLLDADPAKREKLVDVLLERPEYADHWASKWADLLRPNPYRVGIKAVLNYDNWIRESFRQNKPYDDFVRELITARGSTWRNGAATLFRDRRSPDEVTTLVSQLFLGIRLECAKCHHHPFERWEQDDFYRFAAFFARVGHKGADLSPPISGGEEMIYTSEEGIVKHPVTAETMRPKPLFDPAPPIDPQDDPREALAKWVTSDDNDYFANVIVNRVWADLMGRGLVEPVDDLRVTNPPTNAPLLDALAAAFRSDEYDLKKLIRTVTTSAVYSLSSAPDERNVADTRNHSRHYRQRLRAEVLLDAVSDLTGVPDQFDAMPPGSRAAEIWTHRVGSLFLDTFGRPDANQDPPCERTGETAVTQSLHLMNSPTLHRKVTSDEGRAARLAESGAKPDEIVEELYLSVYSRFPGDEERQVGREYFDKDGMTRRQATEDLLWALINTPEFVFKD